MRTGDVKEIRLKGLTSTQNDYECGDGELQVCHNAINTGDGLRPIQQPVVVAELQPGWKGLVFVHHTQGGDIHIVVDDDGNAWWYKDDVADKKEITEPSTGLFTDGGYQVTSVGNVLVINFTGSNGSAGSNGNTAGLHYYRWKDGSYKYIGQAPPDVKLEFAAVHYSGSVDGSSVTCHDDFIIENDKAQEKMKFRADMQFTQGSMLSYEEAFEDFPTWLDYWMGRVNKVKAEIKSQGLFMRPFFVRTAYRLYDGTYIMQGAPVMVAPVMEENPVIWPYQLDTSLQEDSNGQPYWQISVKSRLLYKVFALCVKAMASEEEKKRLKDWEDVIDRVCVFVTPEMQSYTEDPKHMILVRKEKIPVYKIDLSQVGQTVESDDTTIDGKGMDELTQGINSEEWAKGTYRAYIHDEGYYYGKMVSKRQAPPRAYSNGGDVSDADATLSIGDDAKEDDGTSMIVPDKELKYADIDVKMCNTQDWEDFTVIDTTRENKARMLTEFGCFHHVIKFEQKPGTAEEHVEQQYLFYPLKEYTLDEAIKLGTAADTDNKTMTWPYFTLNNASTMWPRKGEEVAAPPDMSFVKFPKDTLDTLTSRTDTLTDDYNSWQTIAPKIVHTYNNRLNAAGPEITFKNVPWTWMGGQVYGRGGTYVGQVVIETGGVTTCATLIEENYKLSVNAGYFYYPHPDAKQIEILYIPGSHENKPVLYKISLKTHPYLHGAYFFDRDFDISKYGTAYETEDAARTAMTKTEGRLQYPNYMYTSEVDNPFFFPSQGVNAIGTGEITAIKSATKAMSEGTAFGTMPLYVFCTDGIWPMSVGETGLFVATNPPTRETLLNNDPDAALQIDNAIIFLSERGLMQLVGERTTLLSGDLQERFSTFDVDDLPGWTKIMGKFRGNGTNGADEWLEADDFLKFINGARMAFDYINYRIIVFKPYDASDTGTHTAYVYDLKSKMWGTMDSTLTSAVEGYPASTVNMVGDGGVTIIGQFDADAQALVGDGKAFYTTRPMKLDKPDVLKTVRTLVERSISHGGEKYLALWGSRDMVKWLPISAVQGSKMPRISGTPYKYFIAAGRSRLDIHGDTISRLTVEERDKYQDKIR